MPDPRVIALLDGATRRLVRTVNAVPDEAWTEPSLLPGWSRAHVVAHLILNAEGLSGALEGVHEGRPVPMYPSQEARDAGIEALAAAEPGELRRRFLGSTTVIAEWIEELAENLEDRLVERVPDGRSFPASGVGLMRLREVEIHHADLGVGPTAADWPEAFVTLVLGSEAAHHAGPGFTAYAVDLDRSWAFGTGGPTVSGPAAALAWWTTGRSLDDVPGGDTVTSDDGHVPGIEAW